MANRSEECGVDAPVPDAGLSFPVAVVDVALAVRHVVVELALVRNAVVEVVDSALALLQPLAVVSLVAKSIAVLVGALPVFEAVDEGAGVGAVGLTQDA
jgi:hypothetical protein